MTFDNKIITFYTLCKRLHARWGNTPKGIYNQNLPLMNRKWLGGVMPKAYLPCTKSLLVLDIHFGMQMIRKNQFMLESDHKNTTLSWNFICGPKLENHFFQSWIFAKRFERFLIFFKNQKRTIFYPNLPPDTYGYWKKVIYHDDGHGKMKKMYISDFWFLKLHHTLFSMIGTAFFKMSKCVK